MFFKNILYHNKRKNIEMGAYINIACILQYASICDKLVYIRVESFNEERANEH